MLLAVALFAANPAKGADYKLYIENLTFDSYGVKEVPLMFDNQVPANGLNVDIQLPPELEMAREPQKAERCEQGMTLRYNSLNGRLMLFSMGVQDILGNSGAVANLYIRPKKGTLDQSKTLSIKLTRINVSSTGADGNIEQATLPDETVTVNLVSEADNVNVAFSTEPASFLVNPGATQRIYVNVDNSAALRTAQFDVVLPEGFSIVSDGGRQFNQTSRISNGAYISAVANTGFTRVMLANLSDNVILDAAGSGAILWFDVAVAADWKADNAAITLRGIQVTSMAYKTVKAADVNIPVSNGYTAYNRANTQIASLQKKLDDALATIAETCKDVKDLFPGTEIQTSINDLKAAVEAAYADMTLTPNYDNVMAPAAGIATAIDKLIADAQAAEKAHTGNEEAYVKANGVADGLTASLNQTLATIAETCKDVKDQFPGTEIANSIEALKAAIKTAYEQKNLVANYESVMAPVAGIQAAIAKLLTDAQAAQQAFETEAARQAAYAKANAEVQRLTEKLQTTLGTIANECPNVKDNFSGKEITTDIQLLKQAIQTAYDNKTIAGDYDNVMAPAAGIDTAIDKLLADAKAAQKAYDDEVAAEQARQEAKKNADAKVAELTAALNNALTQIATECPNVKDQFPGTDITNSINRLKDAIQNAYDNKTIVANYDNIMAPAEGIQAAIAKLIADAKAAQKAYDDEVAANEQAYTNANARVDALTTALNNTLSQIATECPNVKDQFPGTEISNNIAALKAAVKKAYDNKTLIANLESIMAPEAGIQAAIAKLLTDAKAAQKAYDDEVAAEQARQEAKKNADAKVAELTKALADALARIATECPNVKDQFTGTDINNSINLLKVAIQNAYDNKTIVANNDNIMAPAEGIKAAIDKMLADAQAAQKAYNDAAAAEQQAFQNANTQIEALTKALADALTTIATECPDVKAQFPGTEISNNIAALKAAVDKEFENKTLAANYDKVMSPVAGIQAAITKLIADAKAAQKAFAEQSALDQAKVNANKAIAALEKSLADALTTIATECPDVKANFTGTEITAQITVLRNAVNAAYDDKSLATNYDQVMAPAAGIQTAIEKLIADARAAQKKFTDNANAEKARQEAFKKAKARISQLRADLNAALDTIAETCKDVKNDYKGEQITRQIDNLAEAVQNAYDDKTIAPEYDQVMAPAAGIEAAIAKLLTDAKAAQQAYDEAKAAEEARQAANKAAYDADVAAIAELQANLDKAVADALKFYPDFNVATDRDAAQAAINAAQAKALQAFNDVREKGNYSNTIDTAAITALIDVIVPHAAYAKANAAVDELNAALDAALKTIAKDCPDVKDQFTGTEIAAQIATLKEAVDKANKEGKLVADYDNVMAPAADVRTAIEKLITDAKAAQKDEEARQAANLEAYEADLAIIDTLEKELDEAIETVKKDWPTYNYASDKDAIEDAIEAQRAQADAAYAAVADEGTYTNTVDATAIREMIEKMLTDAKEAGITLIYGEELDANDKIYNLQGVQLAEPVKGQINVIVRANGTTEKVYVK